MLAGFYKENRHDAAHKKSLRDSAKKKKKRGWVPGVNQFDRLVKPNLLILSSSSTNEHFHMSTSPHSLKTSSNIFQYCSDWLLMNPATWKRNLSMGNENFILNKHLSASKMAVYIKGVKKKTNPTFGPLAWAPCFFNFWKIVFFRNSDWNETARLVFFQHPLYPSISGSGGSKKLVIILRKDYLWVFLMPKKKRMFAPEFSF